MSNFLLIMEIKIWRKGDSAGLNGSHFEFRVNQESYGCFSVIIGFPTLTNMGVDTDITSLCILEAELSAKT